MTIWGALVTSSGVSCHSERSLRFHLSFRAESAERGIPLSRHGQRDSSEELGMTIWGALVTSSGVSCHSERSLRSEESRSTGMAHEIPRRTSE
jgi:hypothetical protein